MISIKVLAIFVYVSCVGLQKTTHAYSEKAIENNGPNAGNSATKESKGIIELNKDITVNTGISLNKLLPEHNGTESSNTPKIRKVTMVDNYAKRKETPDVNVTSGAVEKANASTMAPTLIKGNAKVTNYNATRNVSMEAANVDDDRSTNQTTADVQHTISSSKTDINVKTNNTELVPKIEKNKITSTTETVNSLAVSDSVATTIFPRHSKTQQNKIDNVITTTMSIPAISTKNGNNSYITKSTTTSTTTTTPKPKKPKVTYSIPDFPDLEKDNPDIKNLLQSSDFGNGKLSIPDGPYAQPSQELNNSSFRRGRDFILPFVSMIFIIPLVIGILITSYRRFRDCWSTRHYRRMDFLVDGMYND